MTSRPPIAALVAAAAAFSWPGAARAQVARELPPELQGVRIEEHLGRKIPLDLTFRDEEGREVRLGDFFGHGRPVILTLVYYECPMLCNLVLSGLVQALEEIDWTPGREFEIVTVSFNPRETSALARLKKRNYLEAYGRPQAEKGWHFLTGEEPAIEKLTQAVGFGYRWNEERKEYAHQAAIFLLAPDGKITRYLYGVLYEPRTLRLSLVEAAGGRIGSTLDRVVLYCFHYDASEGRYTPVVMNFVRAGAGLVVVLLALLLGSLWLRERARRGRASGDV